MYDAFLLAICALVMFLIIMIWSLITCYNVVRNSILEDLNFGLSICFKGYFKNPFQISSLVFYC